MPIRARPLPSVISIRLTPLPPYRRSAGTRCSRHALPAPSITLPVTLLRLDTRVQDVRLNDRARRPNNGRSRVGQHCEEGLLCASLQRKRLAMHRAGGARQRARARRAWRDVVGEDAAIHGIDPRPLCGQRSVEKNTSSRGRGRSSAHRLAKGVAQDPNSVHVGTSASRRSPSSAAGVPPNSW